MIKIDKVGYLKDFQSFKEGKEISDFSIQLWIDKTIKFLEDNPNEKVYSIRSGNTMVIATRYYDDDINIFVCKNYEVAYPEQHEII